MPEPTEKPVYLVDAYADPVIIRVVGRAFHGNCGCLRDFFTQLIAQGKVRFVMDLAGCTGMDSTFLGVLAGTALALRRPTPPGSLVLCRVGRRNLELLRNLGLQRLLLIDAGDFPMGFGAESRPLDCTPDTGELAQARLVLEAHENLVAADPSNQGKFQDVMAFLRHRLEQQ